MSRISRALALSGVLAAVLLSGCGDDDRAQQPPAGEVVVVADGPPAPREEVVEVAPGPEHVWIRGHWRARHHRHEWVWVPGHWEHRPSDDAVWVEGYYVQDDDGRYHYVAGHWR